jgi:hypothetical protein
MRFSGFLCAVLLLLVLGLGGPSCQSVPAVAVVDNDAADTESDAPFDSTASPDAYECNPCVEVCTCTLGDTLYSGNCIVLTCVTGTWGGGGCSSACDDAALAGEGGDAHAASDGKTTAEAMADGPVDSSVDAASTEAGPADAGLASDVAASDSPGAPVDSAASE